MSLNLLVSVEMVLAGFLFMLMTLTSLAKRKMSKPVSMMWIFISVIIILGGIFLHPSQVDKYVSPMGCALLIMIVFCALSGAFFLSVQVSILVRKNEELAQHVSLLNQENREFYKFVKEYKEKQQEE